MPNSPWPGTIKIFPAREILVSDVPAGDEKIVNLFLQCTLPSLRSPSTRPSSGGACRTPPWWSGSSPARTSSSSRSGTACIQNITNTGSTLQNPWVLYLKNKWLGLINEGAITIGPPRSTTSPCETLINKLWNMHDRCRSRPGPIPISRYFSHPYPPLFLPPTLLALLHPTHFFPPLISVMNELCWGAWAAIFSAADVTALPLSQLYS